MAQLESKREWPDRSRVAYYAAVVGATLMLALGMSGCDDAETDPKVDAGVAQDVGADAAQRDTGDRADGEVDDAGATDAEPADAGADDADIEASDASELDADTDPLAGVTPPEPGFIFEVRDQDDPPTADAPYQAETTTHFRLEAQLPGIDASAIASMEGKIYALTASGLVVFDAEEEVFQLVDTGEMPAPSRLADARMDGSLLVAAGDEVWLVPPDGDPERLASLDGAIVAIETDGSTAWAGTSGGVAEIARDGAVASVPWTEDLDVTALGVGARGLYVATADELWFRFHLGDNDPEAITLPGRPVAFAACPEGRTLIGTSETIALAANEAIVDSWPPGPGSLPTDAVTSIACSERWLLVGHEKGGSALQRDGEHVDHYQSRRWIMNDRIADVAITADGTRWLATADGISRIAYEPRTLAGKARKLQALLDAHFWRMDGFVASDARTEDPWSFDDVHLRDKDNDGLWTQMMIGGWVFAHEVTGDAFYCDEARRAFETMILQIDVPCETFAGAGRDCGFITRSLVRDDEGALFDEKAAQSNWHLQSHEGSEYYWKDDTSSDEYAGHFFGYPLYFDHCATEDERALLAEKIALVTDYLIDNGLRLIDLDGEATTHGLWSPADVSSCVEGLSRCTEDPETCFSACFGGGFLNGAEILGHLLAAYHITGAERFYLEYERLIRVHRYDEVIANTDDVLTLHEPPVENHSDHELMMLAFHTLLRYEPNEERRAIWRGALLDVYETEWDERNPLWAAWVAGLTGFEHDRAAAIRSMEELPTDLREWGFDLSHRLDYVQRRTPDRLGHPQFTEMPPYDERRPWWWNGNPYQVDNSGDGRGVRGPMAYLLAYWSMRYYGLLGDEVSGGD